MKVGPGVGIWLEVALMIFELVLHTFEPNHQGFHHVCRALKLNVGLHVLLVPEMMLHALVTHFAETLLYHVELLEGTENPENPVLCSGSVAESVEEVL